MMNGGNPEGQMMDRNPMMSTNRIQPGGPQGQHPQGPQGKHQQDQGQQGQQGPQAQQEKIILFIHNSSKPCQKVMELIKNHSKTFNIDIADISKMNSVPSQIKNLPALVIENGTKLIEGKDVYNYFQKQEIEFVDLNSSGKNYGSSFIESDSLDGNSNSLFSSLNENDMSIGIPEYNEETNSAIDLEKIQKERSANVAIQ